MTPPVALSTETLPPTGDLPAEPAPAETPTPPLPAGSGSNPTSSGPGPAGCLRDAILVILGALAGVALALGLLFYVNGTLDFGRHERVALLASSVEALEGQQQRTAGQIEQQNTALGQLNEAAQARFGQMDEMAGQVADLATEAGELAQGVAQTEAKLAALDAALQTTAADNEAIRAQTDDLAAQVAALDISAERFRVFAAGLRDLATALAGEPPGESEKSASDAATPTATPAAAEAARLPETPALVFFPPLEPVPQPAPGLGLIYGLAWADANADGQPSADETALASWQVNLRDARGQELAAAITDAAGRFVFTDLVPGSYTLTLVAADDAAVQPLAITVSAGPDLLTEANLGLLRP